MNPDWRQEAHYPDPETTSMQCWAWEFLRRNPSYVRDYETYVSLPYWLKDFYYGRPEPPEKEDASLDSFTCYPSATPGDTVRSYLSRHPRGHIDMLDASTAAKYGLQYLVSPQESHSERVAFTDDEWPGMHAKKIGSVLADRNLGLRGLGLPQPFTEWASPEPYSPQEIVVIFNLSLPLEFQLTRAERNLKALRDLMQNERVISVKNKRRQRDYGRYLRVLDAEHAGCSAQEIGKALSPYCVMENEYPDYRRDRAVREDLAAAKKLRDADYIRLPSLAHKVTK